MMLKCFRLNSVPTSQNTCLRKSINVLWLFASCRSPICSWCLCSQNSISSHYLYCFADYFICKIYSCAVAYLFTGKKSAFLKQSSTRLVTRHAQKRFTGDAKHFRSSLLGKYDECNTKAHDMTTHTNTALLSHSRFLFC